MKKKKDFQWIVTKFSYPFGHKLFDEFEAKL